MSKIIKKKPNQLTLLQVPVKAYNDEDKNEFISDGYAYFSDNEHAITEFIQLYPLDGRILPAKFYYLDVNHTEERLVVVVKEKQ